MGRLHELYRQQGQSPWLDNVKRSWITSGDLARWVDRGVRGVTSNPTIFQKAIDSSNDYDEQFHRCLADGASVEAAYWELVTTDIAGALAALRPVHDESDGLDGFVSVEVAPALAHDAAATIAAARALHTRLAAPNLYVKVPGTLAGVDAFRQLVAEGHSVNVTLLFAVERYEQVIDAYLDGLEACPGDLSRVSSVASFFISRVDTEIDRRLAEVGTPTAAALRGQAAIANARLAYARFQDRFRGPRWDALAARGARPQRPLWASTSTKDPSYPDTLYVDTLIGPGTVNTLPDATLAAFEDHGVLGRTVDGDLDGARATVHALAAEGIDLTGVTTRLESEGVAAFVASFDDLLTSLERKARPGR